MSKVEKNIVKPKEASTPDANLDVLINKRFKQIGRTNKGLEQRLRAFYKFWKVPITKSGKRQSLKKEEQTELFSEIGDLINKPKASDNFGLIGNATACAEYIVKVVGYPCTKNDISQWRKGKALPPSAKNPFPLADGANRFNKSEVETWCRDNLPKIGGESGVLKKDSRQIKEDAQARSAVVEAEEAERLLDAKWILKAVAKSSVIGALKTHHQFVKKQLEKRLKELLLQKLVGFTEEQLEVVAKAAVETGKEIVSAIEGDCETHQ